MFEFTSASDDELSLSNMTFTSCKCISGNGGAVYVSIPASKTLTLNAVKFSDCAATKGGAMYIVLEDITSIVEFTKDTCTFTTTNTSDYSLLYIEASDGCEAVSGGEWSDTWTYDELKNTYGGKFWVEEKKEEHGQSGWMLYFVYPPSSDSSITTMYVGPSGADIPTCGWKDFPCLTINYAFKMKSDSVTGIELLAGSHTAIETNTTKITAGGFTIQRESSMTSNPSKSVGAVTVDGSTAVFVVDTESSSEVTIANMDLRVTEGGDGIMSVEKGSVCLTRISVASATPGSAVTMSSSAVSISSGGSASIASCTFTDLTYTGGNGAPLSPSHLQHSLDVGVD